MYRRENNLPLVGVATVLSLATLVTFQLYIWREPARLEADAEADYIEAINAGETLYLESCASCHGEAGLGGVGPALNSKPLLTSISDQQLFGLIRTGVPGTGMPAWGQDFGGPITDEEIRQLVAYIRAWEETAGEPAVATPLPDPNRGAQIFEAICFACHGTQGFGTDQGPALNDRTLLTNFDDDWFRETITQGRPSQGMPTWGTVLSPSDLDDLVALIGLWREGSTIEPPAGEPSSVGEALFAEHCAACHGAAGEGGIGPALADSDSVAGANDTELADLILTGRSGTAMIPFEGRLSPEQVADIVQLLRTWQP